MMTLQMANEAVEPASSSERQVHADHCDIYSDHQFEAARSKANGKLQRNGYMTRRKVREDLFVIASDQRTYMGIIEKDSQKSQIAKAETRGRSNVDEKACGVNR